MFEGRLLKSGDHGLDNIFSNPRLQFKIVDAWAKLEASGFSHVLKRRTFKPNRKPTSGRTIASPLA
jgi:hypothetical protein